MRLIIEFRCVHYIQFRFFFPINCARRSIANGCNYSIKVFVSCKDSANSLNITIILMVSTQSGIIVRDIIINIYLGNVCSVDVTDLMPT